jgi:hypothetical protein
LNPNTTIVATIDNRIQPVITSTPQKDGSIYHIVESGQALWSIAMAYNTKVDTIKKLNSLTNDMVYVGMKLLIQPAVTPTVSPTVTSTSIPPMRTPTHPVTPRPPTATFTPIPSPTPPSLVAGIPNLNRHNLGLLIIVICAIGLLAVGALSIFHRPSKVTGTQDKEH